MSCHASSNQNNLKIINKIKKRSISNQQNFSLVLVCLVLISKRGIITYCLSLIAIRWQLRIFQPCLAVFTWSIHYGQKLFLQLSMNLNYGCLNREEVWVNYLKWYHLIGLLPCLIWSSTVLHYKVSKKQIQVWQFTQTFPVKGIEL